MSSGVSSTGPIVVDTTVFGTRLIKTRAGLARQYQHHVAGREAHISFVTEAELRFGARWAGWGEARLYRLEAVLASADVVLPGPELIEAYVNLRHQCVSTGHGLAQKEHEADRWVGRDRPLDEAAAGRARRDLQGRSRAPAPDVAGLTAPITAMASRGRRPAGPPRRGGSGRHGCRSRG